MGKFIHVCAGASSKVDLPTGSLKGLLVAVPTIAKNPRSLSKAKTFIQQANVEHFMLDSGGYQLLEKEEKAIKSKRTQGTLSNDWEKTFLHDPEQPLFVNGVLNLTPRHVIQTAMDIKPNKFMTLDFPIRKISDRNEQEFEFGKKSKYNVSWTIKTAELRQEHCPEIQLFIPVQCYNLRQFKQFYEAIRDLKFDGFALPVRNMNLRQIALFLEQFYRLGIRRVHLLGTSSLSNMAFAAYMARHYFSWISVDSTTWYCSGRFQTYLNPMNLSAEKISSDLFVDASIKNDCPCPWCRNKTFTDIKNMPYTDRAVFLKSHAYWVTDRLVVDLYANSGNLLTYKNYLLWKTSNPKIVNELYAVLTMIDVRLRQSKSY